MLKALLPAVALTLAAAGAAHAQVGPPPGTTDFDRHRWEVDRHRQALDDQRRQADWSAAQAARARDDARRTSAAVEAARLPPLPYPGARQPAPLAPMRPQGGFPTSGTGGDVGQIDAWLSRP